MQQNTDEWLEWRRKGLGASDASIVMGVSPYKTRRQLWENKLKLRPDDGESFITELGHKFEPRARAKFAIENGIDLKSDICMTHELFPWLRASLDGHCEKERVFAEIKMVGKVKMEWLKANRRPLDEHVPQVQQQFLVTKYERGFYIAYCLDEKKQTLVDYVAFPVQADRKYIDKELFPALKDFWTLVETQVAPELEKRDEYEFVGPEIVKIEQDFLKAKAEFDAAETKFSELQEKIKSLAATHARVRLGKITVTKSVTKGNVDYKSVPQLKGVDLEPFRGKPVTRVTIRAGKEKE